jgi:hypothetical protein
MQVTGALQEKSTGRGQLAKPTQICYSLINHRPERRRRRNATDTPPEPRRDGRQAGPLEASEVIDRSIAVVLFCSEVRPPTRPLRDQDGPFNS